MKVVCLLCLFALLAGCSSVVPYRVPKQSMCRTEPVVDYTQLTPGVSLVETTETVACQATIVEPEGEALYPVVISNRTGYINRRGEIVIAPCVNAGEDFNEGLAKFLDPPSWWREHLESKYDNAYNPRSVRFGFINRRGETVFRPYLFGVRGFNEGIAVGWCGPEGYDHIALLGTNGVVRRLKEIVSDVGYFSEGFATVYFGSGGQPCGYIDRSGRLVTVPMFAHVGVFNEGLAPAQTGSKYGYIETNGLFAIKPAFDQAESFSEGLAGVTVGAQSFFIDRTGRRIGNRSFYRVGRFHEGLAYVAQHTDRKGSFKWTFVNTQGQEIMSWRAAAEDELNYWMEPSFSEGLAAVPVGRGVAFIDKDGKVVFDGYLTALDFRGGLAWVATKSESGYIDKKGSFVWRQPRSAKRQS